MWHPETHGGARRSSEGDRRNLLAFGDHSRHYRPKKSGRRVAGERGKAPAACPADPGGGGVGTASGAAFEMVFPLKRADGMFRPFLTRVNPLRNDAGQVLYWFGTNTDIS